MYIKKIESSQYNSYYQCTNCKYLTDWMSGKYCPKCGNYFYWLSESTYTEFSARTLTFRLREKKFSILNPLTWFAYQDYKVLVSNTNEVLKKWEV